MRTNWRGRLAGIAAVLWMITAGAGQAQERCATMVLHQQATAAQRAAMPGGGAFEQALQDAQQADMVASTTVDSATYRVPVVFHVIHNGEAEGVGRNLSTAQLLSQIRILNEDYNRQPGTRGFNMDARGASANIQFEMATSDPLGYPTTGINRIYDARTSWSSGDNDIFKNLSVWPTDQYLNIWVLDLTDYLGYGSFPVTNLPMGGATVYSNPDGIVLGYKYTGQTRANRRYRYGRTATHEIGHYLGLIHIWGDGDCSATDYCDDTPPAASENRLSCPEARSQCPGQLPPMYQNYMDYSFDSCMNIFTADQVYRMRYVLRNTPNRASLRSSGGLTAARSPAQAGAPRLTIAPNPAQGSTSLICDQATGPARIAMLDATGRLVYQETAQLQPGRPHTLRLAGIAPGVYALRVASGTGTVVLRLVVR